MSRRPIASVCLVCTVAIVVVGCSDGSKATNSTSADKPAEVSRSTSTTSTNVKTNVKTGNGTPTTMTTGVASRTLRPVGVGEPAELARNLFASVTHVTPTTLTAQAPGETSGPGVFVTVTVRNDTDAPVDLDGLAVNAHYGDRIPAAPVRSIGAALHGALAPGGSKSARYAFRVPKDQVGSIRVDIEHSAAPNVVVVDVGK
jgi:hypothetical protein